MKPVGVKTKPGTRVPYPGVQDLFTGDRGKGKDKVPRMTDFYVPGSDAGKTGEQAECCSM